MPLSHGFLADRMEEDSIYLVGVSEGHVGRWHPGAEHAMSTSDILAPGLLKEAQEQELEAQFSHLQDVGNNAWPACSTT